VNVTTGAPYSFNVARCKVCSVHQDAGAASVASCGAIVVQSSGFDGAAAIV
jgi:hypothetical protein